MKGGWQHSNQDVLPTGKEIVEQYLQPAANTPELIDVIHYGAEVIGVTKTDLSKSASKNRDKSGYTVHVNMADGTALQLEAQAVLDASGTGSHPNPIGLDGLPVAGERENQDMIHYGIPDVLNTERLNYQNKKVLVLGAGHSAMNVVLDLLNLPVSGSRAIYWGLRHDNIEKLVGEWIE
ncbi:SidA/IucD/PvdA family monooxygenase [uncultured Shewanella sp.]|uniref:SidA/IucD/PvdA family monooxygenase n=1 Tax=uncultured Shewanella sp. TaxID=173975 RepID=UPI0026363EB7|nr:SidA/IucD/PvdA family monooxygenase [uncultured Shewanella sp.]